MIHFVWVNLSVAPSVLDPHPSKSPSIAMGLWRVSHFNVPAMLTCLIMYYQTIKPCIPAPKHTHKILFFERYLTLCRSVGESHSVLSQLSFLFLLSLFFKTRTRRCSVVLANLFWFNPVRELLVSENEKKQHTFFSFRSNMDDDKEETQTSLNLFSFLKCF